MSENKKIEEFKSKHDAKRHPVLFVGDVVKWVEQIKGIRGQEKFQLALTIIKSVAQITEEMVPVFEGIIEDALKLKLQVTNKLKLCCAKCC